MKDEKDAIMNGEFHRKELIKVFYQINRLQQS